MAEGTPHKGLLERLRDRAEEWIYQLNERNHWVFRVYDWGNELWAALLFRGIRRRAATLDVPIKAQGVAGRLRFLMPNDLDAFATLLASFEFKYVPPHPLDRAAAARALSRSSYLPFGIFVEDRLIGYLLLRAFFPRRVVTGIWTMASHHNVGLAQAALHETGRFTLSEKLPDYATVPVDNKNSVRVANGAGWDTVRTNRRFHVLRLQR